MQLPRRDENSRRMDWNVCDATFSKSSFSSRQTNRDGRLSQIDGFLMRGDNCKEGQLKKLQFFIFSKRTSKIM